MGSNSHQDRMVAEQLGDPVISIDLQTFTIQYANSLARSILGVGNSPTPADSLVAQGFPALSLLAQAPVSPPSIQEGCCSEWEALPVYHFRISFLFRREENTDAFEFLANRSGDVLTGRLCRLDGHQEGYFTLLANMTGNENLDTDAQLFIHEGIERMRIRLQARAAACLFPEFSHTPVFFPEKPDDMTRRSLIHFLGTGPAGGPMGSTRLITGEEGDFLLMIPIPSHNRILGNAVFALKNQPDDRSVLTVRSIANELGAIIELLLIGDSSPARVRLNDVIEHHIEICIIACGDDDKIYWASPTFLEISGIALSHLLEKDFSAVFSDEPSNTVSDRQIKPDVSSQGPEGNTIYWASLNLPVRGLDAAELQQVTRLVVLADISRAYFMEDEVALLKEELASARKSKQDFISNVSHELRTPLNGINGMAQLLYETVPEGEDRELIDTLRMSVSHLNNLIQDLLDFSRLEQDKMRIDRDFFTVSSVIQQAIANHDIEAKSKGLVLEQAPGMQDMEYFSDHGLILQILNNLLSNAVKFTERGSIQLSWKHDQERLIFAVQDSGIGIPDKLQLTIFDSFTQLEHTYTKHRQGLGLGLAICQKLALLLGGSIDLSSTPGEGSTFYLRLPGPAELIRPVRSGTLQQGDIGGTAPIFPGLRVLVAEDDPLNRQMLMKFLKNQGCVISGARDGLEAEHLIRTLEFDILILDISMPETNGYELTQLVRSGAMGRHRTTPILGVTAHVFPEDIAAFRAAGMDDILPKPFIASQLYAKISALFQA